MKKIIDKILNFNYKQYVKTNVLFLSFLLINLTNAMLLRFFTVRNFFALKPIIADIAFILIVGCLVYLFKPKKRIIYLTIVTVILTTVCVVNSIYYTFYMSFASFSLLATSVFIADVGDAVVKNVFHVKDLIFILAPFAMIYVHIFLSKKKHYHLLEKIEIKKKKLVQTLIASIIMFSIFALSLSALEIGRLSKQWNREYLVAKFGIYTYQFNDLISSLEPKFSSLFGYDQAAKEFREFYQEKFKEPVLTNKYTNIFKGKNIIAIHAESIQNNTLGLSFNNQLVAPNLSRMAKEGLYFSNFYPQVSVGTSSDTEFTLNTSLLPVSNGTVFVSYWNREFLSIPMLLKEQGYYAFSMHGNTGSFWNRLVMHKQLGYDKMYDKTYYDIDEEIGLGISDKSFFRQSIPMIKEINAKNQNFYATMIMLSNHTPFADVDKYGEFSVDYKYQITNEDGTISEVSAPYMEGTLLGNYYKSVHYADAAIDEFIKALDAEGLLENTVIVIYGDHDARLPKDEYERQYNYDPYTDSVKDEEDPTYQTVDSYQYELNRKVPFIIWTKDHKYKKEISTVMGMYDVMPTLGNMFGFQSKYALGKDIMNLSENVVIFPNGNWITNNVYYNSQKEEYFVLKDNLVSQEEIVNNNLLASKYLQLSNDLITYDLIRHEKDTLEVGEE